jgi:hypothetical protein
VLKGEDLINNGRMLNFVSNPVREAQIAAMSYYDRTGQYPSASTDGKGPLYQMYQAGIDGVLYLKNPFTTGSNSFAVALGFLSNNGTNYPVIVIKPCQIDSTNGAPVASIHWKTSDIGYANYLKSRVDGSTSNWQTGRVRMLQADIGLTYGTATSFSLATEIGGGIQTNAYDVKIGDKGVSVINGNLTYETDPSTAVNTSDTLVYFYNQQPH